MSDYLGAPRPTTFQNVELMASWLDVPVTAIHDARCQTGSMGHVPVMAAYAPACYMCSETRRDDSLPMRLADHGCGYMAETDDGPVYRPRCAECAEAGHMFLSRSRADLEAPPVPWLYVPRRRRMTQGLN
jgi:hypothetical protein